MILDNPFRLLGLPATASGREVRRSFDELAVKASLGAAAQGLDPDSLGHIRQSLEDPVQRLAHEVFWLHSPDIADPNLDDTAAANGMTVTAIDRLRLAAGRPPNRQQAISLHDLAVLSYAQYERAADAGDPAEMLMLWADVHRADDFWDYLKGRAVDAHDARLTPRVVDELRADLPRLVLAPIAQQIGRLIDEYQFEAAAVALRAIRRSGLPPEAIEGAAQAAQTPLRVRVHDGASAVEEIVASVPSSEGATPANRARFAKAEKVLVNKVLAPFTRLKAIDPVFNDPASADAAAAAARRLSVAICNVLDDWAWGYILLRQAIEIAQTPTYVGQLAAEQAQVRASFHHSLATAAAHNREPLLAAAHIELALPYARNDEERTEWSHLAAGARQSGGLTDSSVETQKQSISAELEKLEETLRARVREASEQPATAGDVAADEAEELPRPPSWSEQPKPQAPPRKRRWGWWISGGVAAAIVAGMAVAAAHSGSNDSSSGGSNGAAAVQQAAVPVGQSAPAKVSCSSIHSVNATIDRMKSQIADKRRLLAQIHAREAPVASAIEKIQRDYPSNQLPSDVWNRWVPLRRQFKTLDTQANAVVRDGNALIRSYNANIRTYNRLVKDC